MKPRPIVHLDRPVKKPKLSIILIDWAVRESFHTLHYLNQQTVSRDEYELLWVEFYDHRPEGLDRMVHRNPTAPLLDRWVSLGYPRELLYHKHRLYNVGILAARADVCVLCDSDAIYSPTFIASLIQAYQESPDAVYHLDQVRTRCRDFYPFNYPTIEQVIASGCYNWTGTTTTGLVNHSDHCHDANYGACMAARRRDLLAVGGADEHRDYLGYMCGPYELTFRLMNYQARLPIWLTNEYLYHTWHPNTSGTNTEYRGPHDGRGLSLRALDSLSRCRIQPVQRSPLMNADWLGRFPNLPRALSRLSERPESCWLPDNIPTAHPDYVYFPFRHGNGFNSFWHRGRWYALPEWEGELDPERARAGDYDILYTADRTEDLDPQHLQSPFARPVSSLGTVGFLSRAARAHPWYALPGRLWRKLRNQFRPGVAARHLWGPVPACVAK